MAMKWAGSLKIAWICGDANEKAATPSSRRKAANWASMTWRIAVRSAASTSAGPAARAANDTPNRSIRHDQGRSRRMPAPLSAADMHKGRSTPDGGNVRTPSARRAERRPSMPTAPMVEYDQAPPEVRLVYDEIMQVKGIDFVPN